MSERTKVLVVDDDRRMAKTICDILKVKGYGATEAHTGEEALEKVRSDPPDCVLMDVKMPGINGVEALRLIKEAAPRLPVVLMSAYATDDVAEQALRLGADAVVSKPLEIGSLLFFLSLLRKEESILVVDDDPNFCGTLKGILRARGYRVETEADPDRVLGHLERDYKLAVLLDLKLGKENSLEILKSIRDTYPGKPVVLITGYREEMSGAVEQGLKIGASTCLYKPLAVEELLGSIEAISGMKRRAVLGRRH